MAAAAAGGAMGGTLLQCTDDRATGLAAWPVGGAHAHAQALATPTLWQYPGENLVIECCMFDRRDDAFKFVFYAFPYMT